MHRSSSHRRDTDSHAQGPNAIDLLAMIAIALIPLGMKATGLRKQMPRNPSADSAARASHQATKLQTEMRNWHVEYEEALRRQKDLAAIVRDPDRGLKNAFAQQALSDANKSEVASAAPCDEDRELRHWTQRSKELHGLGIQLKAEYDDLMRSPGQPLAVPVP